MSIADHRTVISRALGGDLALKVLRSTPAFTMYAGLWSAWWYGDGEVGGVKVVLATCRTDPVTQEQQTTLDRLPWVILQLQTLAPEDGSWGDITTLLRTEMELSRTTAPPCPSRLTYNTAQDDMTRRQLANPNALQEYTMQRVDEPPTAGGRPQDVIDRKRIQYAVFRGRRDDLRPQPVKVYIEHPILTKRVAPGQRLNSESGLSKEGTLLSAVGEWKTWIMLGQ